ncbi:hypothetical protein AMAG_01146 [Allomyces macrogynus ATCC 38327]|uniref:Uncharacterized protein n=1 Tax=Allomyces macrogynus (strain ATCC 38327) TaxID=578462 RepID=A0A0L0RXZ7_ALLM3|nr:hypothetical protein AMAG_01146 [Allomyces macrogynus ATCC 38327]|eukprot:KNE55233.1 hypothetical protein AMAG_01146 [Allomyces macrogynus ATCC 38327]
MSAVSAAAAAMAPPAPVLAMTGLPIVPARLVSSIVPSQVMVGALVLQLVKTYAHDSAPPASPTRMLARATTAAAILQLLVDFTTAWIAPALGVASRQGLAAAVVAEWLQLIVILVVCAAYHARARANRGRTPWTKYAAPVLTVAMAIITIIARGRNFKYDMLAIRGSMTATDRDAAWHMYLRTHSGMSVVAAVYLLFMEGYVTAVVFSYRERTERRRMQRLATEKRQSRRMHGHQSLSCNQTSVPHPTGSDPTSTASMPWVNPLAAPSASLQRALLLDSPIPPRTPTLASAVTTTLTRHTDWLRDQLPWSTAARWRALYAATITVLFVVQGVLQFAMFVETMQFAPFDTLAWTMVLIRMLAFREEVIADATDPMLALAAAVFDPAANVDDLAPAGGVGAGSDDVETVASSSVGGGGVAAMSSSAIDMVATRDRMLLPSAALDLEPAAPYAKAAAPAAAAVSPPSCPSPSPSPDLSSSHATMTLPPLRAASTPAFVAPDTPRALLATITAAEAAHAVHARARETAVPPGVSPFLAVGLAADQWHAERTWASVPRERAATATTTATGSRSSMVVVVDEDGGMTR